MIYGQARELPGIGIEWTNQLVFNGFVTGLGIGLLAMGIVLVYRSTRVINFAVGNMGLVGASLLALMTLNYDFPFGVALPLALAVGTLFGAAIELTVVRRLFTSPRVILLVATVGVAQLAQAIIATYPDIDAAGNQYPIVVDKTWETALNLQIESAQLSIIVVVIVVAVALGWLLNRTTFGKSVTGSADNPELSRLCGVSPKVVSTFVWAIAGLLSTVSMILLSGENGSVNGLSTLGPLTLGKAMVAAVLAGMRSFPRAVVAGIAIGVLEAVITFNYFDKPGLINFVLFIFVLLAVYKQSRHNAEVQAFSFVPSVQPVPESLRGVWWVRHLNRIGTGFGLSLVVLVTTFHQSIGFITISPSRFLLYSTIVCFAICAASVSVITGWSGQLSLSQMTFAGLGALTAAALHRGVEMDFLWGFVDFEAPAIPFMLSIVVAPFVVAVMAAVIGVGALRVRGLLLAVTTFVFAIAAELYIFRRPVFSDGQSSSVQFRRTDLFGMDLSSQHRYFNVCLAALVVVLVVLGRLHKSGVGRSTIAVRDNPDTASAYTVSPTRQKLSAFALAGGVAALGGALLSGLIQNVPLSDRFFLVEDSLRLVGMVVIGGIGSLMGAVVGALWVVGLPAFFPDNELVPLFTSSVGLLFILMYFPGGLMQIAYSGRDALFRWLEARTDSQPSTSTTVVPASVRSSEPAAPLPATVLSCRDVSVNFGGNMAVSASIELDRDEIVGLIGTNGAGKSTFMNAVGGFVPSTGVVELLGQNVSRYSAPRRARLGLGRTFQAPTLFPELSVRETVQVALEARRRTPFVATALFAPPSGLIERTRRQEADELIGFLGLGRYSDSFISGLSTGTRRIVELACLLAADAKVLCLDEPTAGVAQRETEAFGPLIVQIRKELGASMLIIEHDMPLIMSISDRVYCLEAGAVIAEGEPIAVRNDPRVIASYLGTDDRAIDRSNA